MTDIWLPSTAFGALAGIARQKAHRALRRELLSSHCWRGANLVVRAVHGRGGRSGLQYQVRVDSLPLDLQERWKALQRPVNARLNHGAKAQVERDRLYGIISSALPFAKGSPERASAVRDIAARRHMKPDGSWETLSERTIQRKLQRFEASGSVAALSRPKRIDVGAKRVILSRRWDEAVSLPEGQKQRIADQLREYVRSLHKDGEPLTSLRALASNHLAKLTAENAGPIDTATCVVPINFIQAERIWRKVHTFKTDRKAYEDTARPRVRRTRAGYMPMDVVVADIHPIDIYVRREDGSPGTPRGIAWLDIATNRIWIDVVLLEKGEGIRNAHVIASFLNMVRHWGAPRALYLDNGSEYNWAEFVDDALKLIDRDGNGKIAPWTERVSQIIRAQAYNAAAKPVEGVFSTLETHHFSRIPGWSGGDRLRKKSANVGRDPEPFPGTFDELRTLIGSAVDYYESMPQRGSLGGKSPRSVFDAAVKAGWQKTQIEPNAFRIAFSTEESRKVHQGSIKHAGQFWTCPELQAYQGDRVTALIPKYEDWSALPLRGEDGELLGFARPDTKFGFLDPAGAREAKKRQLIHRNGVRALDRTVPDIDPLAERAAFVAALPPPPVPPTAAIVTPSYEAARFAAELKLTPAELRDREAKQRVKNQEKDRKALEREEALHAKFAANRRIS